MNLNFLDCFCANTDEQTLTVVIFLTCRSFTTWSYFHSLLPLKSLSPPAEISHQKMEEAFHSTDVLRFILP